MKRRRRPAPSFLALSQILLIYVRPPRARSHPSSPPAATRRRRDDEICDPCASAGDGLLFKVKPGTACAEYIQCFDGENVEELRCQGETIFDEKKQFCDWKTGTDCVEAEESTCPPTREPSTDQPTMPVESCANPCPVGFTGFRTRPSSRCKQYVSCDGGQVAEELKCFGDTVFNQQAGYCDWPHSYSCRSETCPEREPTRFPAATISAAVPDAVVVGQSADCPNPCPVGHSGFKTRPGTQCKKYVSCDGGQVANELECFGDTLFNPTAQYCDWPANTRCEAAPCPEQTRPTFSPITKMPTWNNPRIPVISINLADDDTESPRPSASARPTNSPVRTPRPMARPTPRPTAWPTRRPTPWPTTRKPTPAPIPVYQLFRTQLLDKEDEVKSIVLQSSNGRPSAAYTFPDFVNALDVAVFQFPANKAFFVGAGTTGRLPKLSGVEYGLVNIALFLSHAMQEGIRIDSCDEHNTDFLYDDSRDKYPLSNACGEYGRSYQDEVCPATEPFHCALDRTLEITAVDGSAVAPPFMCKPRVFDGAYEIFPGYYDSVDDAVIQSAYSNTLGRTDVEGCCYWGRGVLLTRGRCTIGKLDKYIGQGAVDRGVYVYPDINFCSNPEVICTHSKSNELRWVLGMLEWTDRVQSYVDSDSDWKYMDQLVRFVDEGMVDDEFIDAVTNIVARNCHDNSCDERWYLDEGNNVFKTTRRGNFRRVISNVFNLPLTYHPTLSPSVPPTLFPTITPSVSERPTPHPTQGPTIATNKPTKRKKVVRVDVFIKGGSQPPSAAQRWRISEGLALLSLALSTSFLWI